MLILHSLPEKLWHQYQDKMFYGIAQLDEYGYIHCSEISSYKYVAPNFKETKEKMLLLVIDTDRVQAEIKWEDFWDFGIKYPHIYGMLNMDAIIEVLPHLWSEDKEWIINNELELLEKRL